MKSRSIQAMMISTLILTVGMLTAARMARADDKEKAAAPKSFAIGDEYQLTTPEAWATREPRSRIIDHEFAVTASKEDELEGRVTVMAAGGTADANLERWYGQFTQPDGSATKDKVKITKKQIAGKEITIVDLSGTYMDRPAPMAPGVERENYRMLAAIIPAKGSNNIYVKFYGPKQTVADNAEAFTKMIDSLRQK